jgi:UDP-glucose 4-epimerase
MLKHRNEKALLPSRVVILGAKGFVGQAIIQRLAQDNIPVMPLGREDIDLEKHNAAGQLAKQLHADDTLIIVSAKAPCKNNDMLLKNIQMMKSVCDALAKQPVQHVMYISSDAVYTDSIDKLHEGSPAAPTSLHGAMHLAREQMLRSILEQDKLVILRPSLLYGANDPHNGYGPNSFYRLACAKQPIELFGQGEELRDHVYIEDVANLVALCLLHRSYGVLNITTGEVASFHQIAELIGQVIGEKLEIKSRPRQNAMPHNGYRAFDNTICKEAFLSFQYTTLLDGLNKMHQNMSEDIYARN